MLMHMLSHRGTADRLPLPAAPDQSSANHDPALREQSPSSLSREELRRIVMDLMG
jgi:hypothetical protein